ncbi:DUF2267 domain-containing protein [Tranquillimonas rosea]|uniref:DUF2267 domain-containing protein n=1 Tax=Tranquillimonas rosea TaxID=641238 RepID=UPI003BADBE04
MPEMGLEVIDRTVNDTNNWLNQISKDLGCDKKHAYHVLRGGLHTLRDRMTVEEAAHLSAQLPHLIRGIYYENWRPADAPQKLRDREEYLTIMVENVGDRETEDDPEEAARAVFRVLKANVDPNELRHVGALLPDDVTELYQAA